MIKLLLLTSISYTISDKKIAPLSWNPFLKKPISICLLSKAKTTLHLVTSNRNNFNCFIDEWQQCIDWQYLGLPEQGGNLAYTRYWPCIRSRFVWKSQDPITYHVYSRQAFQFNLTFTYFHLQRTLAGCVFHHITVSSRCHRWVRFVIRSR